MRLWLGLYICVTVCGAAKILGVFNHPGGSHTFLGKILLKSLSQKGHQVVMISAFPMKETVPNYKDIPLPEHFEHLQNRDINLSQGKRDELVELKNMTLKHTEDTFTNPEVKKLLHSKEHFDVIIIDWFYNEATLIFGHIFKAPVIYMSSFGNMLLLNDFTGNTLPFSYVPGAGLLMHDDISLKHKVIMTAFNIINSLLVPSRHKAHYEILKRHFKDPPTIEDLQDNIALVLSNSHFSFETPRPYTPNIIPVGGLHIEEVKELPQHLKKFLDSSTEGVVYIGLGSQIKSSNLDKNILLNIIKALGRIPQKVLWKYENDDLLDLPGNIKIMSWIPQTGVLAHHNVKLFITHCGMLSLIESVHFEVPLICLPFNGDQFTNAAFVASRNIGLQTSPHTLTEDTFFQMIQDITTNPKYQKEMTYRSSLLREQPVKPIDQAIYWVEHVIKHKHGKHLKTFATKLPWYKYYLIDVIGVFVGVTSILITLIYFLVKTILIKAYRFLSNLRKRKTA